MSSHCKFRSNGTSVPPKRNGYSILNGTKYLKSRKAEDYLLQSLSSVLTSTVQDSENRLARMDFKIAVELSKLSQVIAYTHDVDEESLNRLHAKCVEEVKRINGAVDFEDAYRYQRREN